MATVSPRARSAAIIFSGTLLLHAVFLCGMAAWLWSREHYQFFPLVICASGILAWYRLENAEWNHSPCLSIRVMIFGAIAFILFALASLLNSNWLGSLAGICSLWTLIWLFGGQQIARRLRGPVFFLLLAIPLPLNLDLTLVIALQKAASGFASSMLDLRHVWHTVSGVAINTQEKSFMVDEACSGIHSLFSCLCVVVFVSVIQRFGFIRIVFNIIQTIGWVIAANAIRVFLIVEAYTNWGIALDSGWRHDALGVFTYAIALLMALSTDRLIQFVIPPSREVEGKAKSEYAPSENAMKELLSLLKGDTKWLNFELNRSRFKEGVSLRVVAVTMLALFAPLAAVSYGRILTQRSTTTGSIQSPLFAGDMSQAFQGVDVLPKTLGSWNLVNVERLSRSADDPLGTNSTVFTYEAGGLKAQFSVDGYYSKWHDLAYCYTAMDWNLESQKNELDPESDVHSTRMSLYTDDGHYALSVFSCFDSQFQSVRPDRATLGVIDTFRNILDRLPGNKDDRDRNQIIEPPVFQLQIFCSADHDFLDHERSNLDDLYKELRRRALRSLREGAK